MSRLVASKRKLFRRGHVVRFSTSMLSDYHVAVLVNISVHARAGMVIGALCGGLVGSVVRLSRGWQPVGSSFANASSEPQANHLAIGTAGRQLLLAMQRIARAATLGLVQAMLPAALAAALAAMAVSAILVAQFPNNSGYVEVPDWASMLQITVVLMTAAAIALCLPSRPTSNRRAAAAAAMWMALGGIDGAGVSLAGVLAGLEWRFNEFVIVLAAVRGALFWGTLGIAWRISAEGLLRRSRRQSPDNAATAAVRVAESPWD